MASEQARPPDSESGAESHARDRALVRLDEKEVKARMLEAFDRFVETGFEVNFMAYKERESVAYKLGLGEDGADDLPLRDVQAIADEFRLDAFIERGGGIVLYARW